jgi:hypothetical protein
MYLITLTRLNGETEGLGNHVHQGLVIVSPLLVLVASVVKILDTNQVTGSVQKLDIHAHTGKENYTGYSHTKTGHGIGVGLLGRNNIHSVRVGHFLFVWGENKRASGPRRKRQTKN